MICIKNIFQLHYDFRAIIGAIIIISGNIGYFSRTFFRLVVPGINPSYFSYFFSYSFISLFIIF